MKQNSTFGILAILVILASMMLSGCTTKNNPTGTGNSELEPIFIQMNNSYLQKFFTYQDTVENNGNTGNLSVGMRDELSAVALLMFETLPDSTVCDSAMIELHFEDRWGQPGQTLQVAKVMQPWDEDAVTWQEAQDGVAWNEPRWELLDTSVQTTDADSILIPLPLSLVQSWVDGDTTNYGLALLSEEQGICQFHSAEGSDVPSLFIYHTQSDTVAKYTLNVTYDAFICDGAPQSGELTDATLANVVPTRMYTMWDLSLDAFNTALPDSVSIADSTEMRRTTINSAELIVQVDTTFSYIPEDVFNVYSFLVIDSVSADSLPYSSDQLKSFAYTDIGTFSEDEGTLTIDVTPIVQAIVSNIEENRGIVVSSLQETINMGFVRFDANTMKLEILLTRPPGVTP